MCSRKLPTLIGGPYTMPAGTKIGEPLDCAVMGRSPGRIRSWRGQIHNSRAGSRVIEGTTGPPWPVVGHHSLGDGIRSVNAVPRSNSLSSGAIGIAPEASATRAA
jgi:hypothetical protein